MDARFTVSVFALLVAAGCSGADETELFGPVARGQAANEPAPAANDDTSSSGATQTGGSTSTSGGDDQKKDDNGGSQQPTPPATNACTAEKEPNDERDEANAFTSCFSGALKHEDVDHARTTAPATATKMSIVHDEAGGSVWYRISVDGTPYPAFTGDLPTFIPAKAGARYDFEMSPAGGNASRTYTLNVSFE
jgi:hypothetical protein